MRSCPSRLVRFIRPWLERLEERLALSFTWVPQGPGPLLNGQPLGLEPQGNPDVGAINALAPDPTNPDLLYAATVNGGIWKTTDATASSPSWVPLTDGMPALDVGDIAFSPLSTSTLYAGLGNFTNGSFGANGVFNGGAATGVLKSTDGSSWTLLAASSFTDQAIRSILPAPLSGGQVVLAGTVGRSGATGGVYRSEDGGVTWARVSGAQGSGLPDGNCRSLVEDPANPSTIYAAVIGQGVYQSTDGGMTWASVNSAIPGGILSAANNLLLAAHTDLGTTTLFLLTAAPSDPTTPRSPGVSHLFYTTNAAQGWTEMDAVPQINQDDQEGNNLSLSADPSSPTVVWVSGSAADVGGGGRSIAYRGDYSQPSGSQWVVAVWKGAAGTPPGGTGNKPTITHSDSRSLTFDAAGNLLLTSDGGMYKLVNPEANTFNSDHLNTGRYWVSLNGDVQDSEFYSVAYDAADHVVAAGAQDNGMGIQPAPGQTVWDTGIGGDVTHVAVNDAVSPAQFYSGGGGFDQFTRIAFGSLSQAQVLLASPQTPTQADSGLVGADTTATSGAYIPFVLDAVDPNRMLIGFNNLYEDAQAGAPHMTGDIINPVTPTGPSGEFTALAYGGTAGGVANPDVAVAGTTTGTVYVRTTSAASGGTFTLAHAFDGSDVRAVTLDPADWHTVCVVTSDTTGGGHVWQMTVDDTGAEQALAEITGNLESISQKPQSIVVVHPAAGVTTVVVGGLGTGTGTQTGGVFQTGGPVSGAATTWALVGSGMPEAQVHGLVYNAADDVLVAGTFGRGAWTLPHASEALLPTPPSPPVGGGGGSPGTSAGFPASVSNQLFLDLALLPSFRTPQARQQLTRDAAALFAAQWLESPQQASLLLLQEAEVVTDLALGMTAQAQEAAQALAANPLYATPQGYLLGLLEGALLLGGV
jgi:hypothetical protein